MLKNILLGAVQGLAEFLPVSSSGHLVLMQKLMHMPETGLLMEILLHVGTLAAVLIVYWKDVAQMLRHPFQDRAVRLLIVATLPAVAVALIADEWLEAAFSGRFLGASFLITAGLLFISDALARVSGADRGETGVNRMSARQALCMGCMQALAIVPGISRSGATIVGGLAAGVPRETAAKFSFLMSAVATVGSVVFKGKELVETIGAGGDVFEGGIAGMAMGMIVAGLSGYAAIRWMLRVVERASLKGFGAYMAIMGIAVLVLG